MLDADIAAVSPSRGPSQSVTHCVQNIQELVSLGIWFLSPTESINARKRAACFEAAKSHPRHARSLRWRDFKVLRAPRPAIRRAEVVL